MVDYWKTFQYLKVIYQNTSSVFLVQFGNLEAAKPRLGVIKQTPLSVETRREAAIHHTLSFVLKGVLWQRDIIEYQGHLIEVMDYANYGSLRSLIAEKRSPLSREDYLLLVYRLMKVVVELHEQCWAHGDISPDNFVLDCKKEWKIIDFGQTRKIRKAEPGQVTNPERVTKLSAKPESLFLEDIWQLGLTLYWAGTRDCTLATKPAPGQHWILEKYVESKLGLHYDSQVVWLVQQMLHLSEGERGSLRFLMGVAETMVTITEPERRVSHSVLCTHCGNEAPTPEFTLELTCAHVICLSCFKETVTSALNQGCSIHSIPCVICLHPIDYEVLKTYRTALAQDTRVQLSNQYYLTLTTSCGDQTCKGTFPMFKSEGSGLRAYNAKCPDCEEVWCSHCKHRKGHERNGYEIDCPLFKPEAFSHIFAN